MRTWLPLMLIGCAVDEPGGQGIAVGNPPGRTQLRVTVADGLDVAMTALELPIAGVYLETCDGLGQVIDAPAVLGLGDGVQIDAGTYCALGLVPTDAPVVLEGAAGEGTFRFSSGLGRIFVYGEMEVVEGAERVLELAEPEWIAAADFGLAAGEHLELGDRCLDDPLCERIRAGLMDRSGLYDDTDGDGEVSTDERDTGADGAGSDRREPTRD